MSISFHGSNFLHGSSQQQRRSGKEEKWQNIASETGFNQR